MEGGIPNFKFEETDLEVTQIFDDILLKQYRPPVFYLAHEELTTFQMFVCFIVVEIIEKASSVKTLPF